MWELIKTAEANRIEISSNFSQKYGITPLQARVLIQIFLNENSQLGKLADDLFMNPGNLSKICKSLESKNLIERSRSESDNRSLEITASKHGKELVADFQQLLFRRIQDFTNVYSEEQLKEILQFLKEYNLFMAENFR